MARSWRFKSQLAGLALLILPTRSAWASEPPVDLSWQAPSECPRREVVLARVQAMLGASASSLAPLRVAGTIERRGTGFELRLSIDDGKGGERVVPAERCEELGGAAAVALVLLLTNRAQLEESRALDGTQASGPGTESNGAAGGEKKTTTQEAAEAEAEDEDDSADSSPAAETHWLVGAPLFALGVGPLPKPHPALGIALGVEHGAFSARVIGHWGLSQDIPAKRAGYGVELSRASAGLLGCARIGDAELSVAPCLHGMVTHVFGRGYGPSLRSVSQRETSGALGVLALGRWRIHDRVALLAGGGVQVELSRPFLILDPLGTVDQLAPISATLLLGPEWIF